MGSTAVAGLYDRLEENRSRPRPGGRQQGLLRPGSRRASVGRNRSRDHPHPRPRTPTSPYHQRIDDGFVRFVNNDHCLLSSRASLALPDYLPGELRYLPMAQTIWYVPLRP